MTGTMDANEMRDWFEGLSEHIQERWFEIFEDVLNDRNARVPPNLLETLPDEHLPPTSKQFVELGPVLGLIFNNQFEMVYRMTENLRAFLEEEYCRRHPERLVE